MLFVNALRVAPRAAAEALEKLCAGYPDENKTQILRVQKYDKWKEWAEKKKIKIPDAAVNPATLHQPAEKAAYWLKKFMDELQNCPAMLEENRPSLRNCQHALKTIVDKQVSGEVPTEEECAAVYKTLRNCQTILRASKNELATIMRGMPEEVVDKLPEDVKAKALELQGNLQFRAKLNQDFFLTKYDAIDGALHEMVDSIDSISKARLQADNFLASARGLMSAMEERHQKWEQWQTSQVGAGGSRAKA